MSEITGRVKEIFQGEVASGRNQGDPFWSITLEENPDAKITCFAEEEKKGWIEGLEQNREYTFTVKVSKDEKYKNIAGQTVPCEDINPDGRLSDESIRDESPTEKPKTPVKIATKRKPPVTTSTAGTERVFKNRISALQAAVTYASATVGTVDDIMENAEKFYTWISE